MPVKFRQVLVFALCVIVASCGRTPAEDRRDVVLVPDQTAAPLKIRAMFHYGAGYNAPVQALSLRGRGGVQWPTAFAIEGCANSVGAKDFPNGFLVLGVDESPDALHEPTLAEACQSKDPADIQRAVVRQLDFLRAHVGRLEVADTDHVIIFASGEAAPVAAGYTGAATGKVLLGDPCIVSWPSRPDARTPSIVLRGDEATGLGWDQIATPTSPNVDVQDRKSVEKAFSANTKACPAQARPVLPRNYKVVEKPGRVTLFGRPAGLQDAGRAFMADLISR